MGKGGLFSTDCGGLGFRYRWATQGLTERELAYRPGESCRSIIETLSHIHNLVVMTATGFTGERYSLPEPTETKSFNELRQATLVKVQQLSEQLKATPSEKFDEMPVRFKMGDEDLDFPFWNAINGMVADALYHAGQRCGQPLPRTGTCRKYSRGLA